jgi:transposase InsO family protein
MLQVSRSDLYAWQRQSESARTQANQHLAAKIRVIHRASRRTYGSPQMHGVLREDGECCGRYWVAFLMRVAKIRAKTVRKFRATNDSTHKHPVAENIFAQNFCAKAHNQGWVSDSRLSIAKKLSMMALS